MERIKYVVEALQSNGEWVPRMEYYNSYEANLELENEKNLTKSDILMEEETEDRPVDFRVTEKPEHYIVMGTNDRESLLFNDLLNLENFIESNDKVVLRRLSIWFGPETDQDFIEEMGDRTNLMIVEFRRKKKHWWSPLPKYKHMFLCFYSESDYLENIDYLVNKKYYKEVKSESIKLVL
jgi:hypothetical protein